MLARILNTQKLLICTPSLSYGIWPKNQGVIDNIDLANVYWQVWSSVRPNFIGLWTMDALAQSSSSSLARLTTTKPLWWLNLHSCRYLFVTIFYFVWSFFTGWRACSRAGAIHPNKHGDVYKIGQSTMHDGGGTAQGAIHGRRPRHVLITGWPCQGPQ